MYTICHFEDQEVRSPTLQTVCKSKLKQRSYGCLKTTVQSWTKWVAKFRRVFRSCETTPWHTSAISQLHPLISQLWNGLRNGHKIGPWPRSGLQAAKQVANRLQVAESPPSCEITNSTCKIKVQTYKMDNLTCESPCEIHLCNLRYL